MWCLPRAFGMWLAALAMLVRAGVPDGWMPNPVDSPGSPLIMCPGQNMMMPMAQPPAGKQGQQPSSQHHSCPFGALSQAPSIQIAADSVRLEGVAGRPDVVPILLLVAAPQTDAHSPRGPPLFL